MSSDKQNAANRRNAQSSTGPRDTRRTSRNATKHGLTAEGITEKERPAQEKMAELLVAHFRPVGPIEEWLLHRISLLTVRIERTVAIEKGLLAYQIQHNQVLADPLAEVLAMQARALGQNEAPIRCVVTDKDIRKLNESVGRYETALENKLYRALHELERQQRLRRGECIPAPAAGDLTIHAPPAAAPAREPAGVISPVQSEEL